MGEEILTVFEAMRIILFWFSPVLFILGIVVALYSNYRILEEKLGRNLIPIKVKRLLVIETNIYTFHEWLMNRRVLVGLSCIVFSVVFFLVFKA